MALLHLNRDLTEREDMSGSPSSCYLDRTSSLQLGCRRVKNGKSQGKEQSTNLVMLGFKTQAGRARIDKRAYFLS